MIEEARIGPPRDDESDLLAGPAGREDGLDQIDETEEDEFDEEEGDEDFDEEEVEEDDEED